MSMSLFDYISQENLDDYLSLVFEEDFKDRGDITTEPIFADDTDIIEGKVIAKEEGIVAGIELFDYVLHRLDDKAQLKIVNGDGSKVVPGDQILRVSSTLSYLLKAERICLNFLGKMSGIATTTFNMVETIKGTRCNILDTRKTTPGLRFMEKYAVKVGGGVNHRMGLYDQIIIKDNHIDGAGGISNCINRVRSAWGDKYRIIVETRSLTEVKEARDLKVDRILLDNMSTETIREAVKEIAGQIPLEASGNITLENAKEYAETGIDYISTSYVTMQARPLDISLVLE